MTNWVEIEHVDALPVRGATLSDFDFDSVARHLQQARNVGVVDPHTYLVERQGLIEIESSWVPTLGGLLCFGKVPQRLLKRTGISLTRYSSNTPNSRQVIDIRDLEGTLFNLINQAEEYVWAQSNHGFRLDSGPRRLPVDQYPRTALRELIVNAVAHRDYRVTGSQVKIELFRNEVEWSSPGGLPPGITVDNILKSQYTRNPVLVAFLFDAGYIEQRGMGLDTVFNLLQDEELPLPQMEDNRSNFTIRIMGNGSLNQPSALGLDAPLTQIYTLLDRAGREGIRARPRRAYEHAHPDDEPTASGDG